MSAPWIAVVVCQSVLIIALAIVVVGVLRRAVGALDAVHNAGFSTRDLAAGPPIGTRLPAMSIRGTDGSDMTLADMPGPFVLAVLTSHCAPCRSIAEQIREDEEMLAGLEGLVVITDQDGPERLGLREPIRMVIDSDGLTVSSLDLPGTPYVIAVDADGAVQSAQLLAGPAQIVSFLDSVRSTEVRTPS